MANFISSTIALIISLIILGIIIHGIYSTRAAIREHTQATREFLAAFYRQYPEAKPAKPQAVADPNAHWKCPSCGHDNWPGYHKCEKCGSAKPE